MLVKLFLEGLNENNFQNCFKEIPMNINDNYYENIEKYINYIHCVKEGKKKGKTDKSQDNIEKEFMEASSINSNNNKIYSSISNKYCGNHYIITTENEIEKNLKIELNKINGAYAAKNLLCEYIFFSGPNEFDIKININEKDSNNFYLLFGKDILNISQIMNVNLIVAILMIFLINNLLFINSYIL